MEQKPKEQKKVSMEDHGPTNQAGLTLREYWEMVAQERLDRERERGEW